MLLIKNVKPSDSDVYVCEVNSDPMLRSFHPLRVKSKSIKADNNDTSSNDGGGSGGGIDDIIYADDNKDGMPPITHDFTQCCDTLNVSAKCRGFCTVHNIIDGSTGVEPEACEADFPNIVKCMADGRNHVPCCERKKIPDICQVRAFYIFICWPINNLMPPYSSCPKNYSTNSHFVSTYIYTKCIPVANQCSSTFFSPNQTCSRVAYRTK